MKTHINITIKALVMGKKEDSSRLIMSFVVYSCLVKPYKDFKQEIVEDRVDSSNFFFFNLLFILCVLAFTSRQLETK